MASTPVAHSAGKVHLVLMLVVILLDVLAIIERFAHVVGDYVPNSTKGLLVLVPTVLVFFATHFNPKVRFKRFWRHVSKALLLLAVVVVVFVLFPRHPVSSRLPVLIAELEDHTEDRAFSSITGQILLKLSLEQSPRISVFPEARVNDTLRRMGKLATERVTASVGKEICQREGVGPLIVWNAEGSDNKYTLSAQILDPLSDSILSEVKVGPFENTKFVEAVGSLGKGIRKRFGDSSLQIYKTSKPLMAATTASLPALKAYSVATQHLNQREYSKAKADLSKALELDPNFAMALVDIASLYDWEGNADAAIASATRAFNLRDTLTEPEKVRVAGYYYWVVLNDHQRAFNEVSEFVKQYPRNLDRLGTLVYEASAMMKFEVAEDASWKLLGPLPWKGFSTEDAFALWRAQLSLNEFPQAIQTAKEVDRVQYVNGTYLTIIPHLAASNFAEVEKLLAEQQHAGKEEAVSWLRGVSNLYAGKLQSTSDQWTKYIELLKQQATSESRWVDTADAHLGLARVELIANRPDTARAHLDKVKDVRDEYLAERGKYYARLGDLQKAREILDNLQARLAKRSTNQNESLLLLLKSEIELKQGNLATSSSLISQASQYRWNYLYWQVQESRAYIALVSGNFEETIKACKEMIERRGLAFAWDRPDDWVMAHYYLARAYEALGQKDLAVSYYLDFERLWAKGDAEVPPLVHARNYLYGAKRPIEETK